MQNYQRSRRARLQIVHHPLADRNTTFNDIFRRGKLKSCQKIVVMAYKTSNFEGLRHFFASD